MFSHDFCYGIHLHMSAKLPKVPSLQQPKIEGGDKDYCFVPVYGDSHLQNKPKSCVAPSDACIKILMLMIIKPEQTKKQNPDICAYLFPCTINWILFYCYWVFLRVFQNVSTRPFLLVFMNWDSLLTWVWRKAGMRYPMTSHCTQDAMSPAFLLNLVWGLISEHKECWVFRKGNPAFWRT